jgi:hypothetical protein
MAMADDTATEQPKISEDTLKQAIELIKKEPAAEQSGFWRFVSSGFFFMLVGAATLWWAFYTMGNTHASFTFVLVVVGVAVLLYGTGTQGVGNFETAAGELKYKIGMAGGAGILAFCVGIGIVEKSSDIKRAFQIEKKYLRLSFSATNDGISTFNDYVPEIVIDGVSAPVYRNGNNFVAFVSYFDNRELSKIRVLAKFHYVGQDENRNKSLMANVLLDRTIDIDHTRKTIDDGSYDFPRYPEEFEVAMARNERSEQEQRELDKLNRGDAADQSEELPLPPLVTAQ